ncbi:MAG: universal stress protein [Haloarculaceae archaeon]
MWRFGRGRRTAPVATSVAEVPATVTVVLLGYHEVPDQTAPGQARMQFEDRAAERLDEFEAILEDAGATVETRLVFTHEKQDMIDRVIVEHDCLAVLVPNATVGPESVLVAVRGTVGVDRLVRVVPGLFADTGIGVTLYHVADEDETDVARGVAPQNAIADVADQFDAVVMGESDPSLATFVFGMRAEQVAERFLGPVIVIQREKPDATDEGDAEQIGD